MASSLASDLPTAPHSAVAEAMAEVATGVAPAAASASSSSLAPAPQSSSITARFVRALLASSAPVGMVDNAARLDAILAAIAQATRVVDSSRSSNSAEAADDALDFDELVEVQAVGGARVLHSAVSATYQCCVLFDASVKEPAGMGSELYHSISPLQRAKAFFARMTGQQPSKHARVAEGRDMLTAIWRAFVQRLVGRAKGSVAPVDEDPAGRAHVNALVLAMQHPSLPVAGSVPSLEMLLDVFGSNPNDHHCSGLTPLIYALTSGKHPVSYQRLEWVQALIKAGADPSLPARCAPFNTPLHECIPGGENSGDLLLDIFLVLLRAGADPSRVNERGVHAIHQLVELVGATRGLPRLEEIEVCMAEILHANSDWLPQAEQDRRAHRLATALSDEVGSELDWEFRSAFMHSDFSLPAKPEFDRFDWPWKNRQRYRSQLGGQRLCVVMDLVLAKTKVAWTKMTPERRHACAPICERPMEAVFLRSENVVRTA